MIRQLLAAFRFQSALARRSVDTLHICVTTPLFTAVILMITQSGGRTDLVPYAVVAPTLMSLWTFGLSLAGEIIFDDRVLGTLEGQVAAPAPFSVTVLGRMCVVTVAGLASFAEAWLTVAALSGHWPEIPHPLVLLAGVLVTGLATAGTACLLAPLFVLSSSARTLQNTLTYPFYLLSGVLVPVSFLPDWLQPLARAVFLFWSADLLRESFAVPAVADVLPRLATILVLGAAGYGIGMILLSRVVGHVRRTGTLSHT
ncbi:ABC transporter permease [Amycolatopsis sp. NPDC054798]